MNNDEKLEAAVKLELRNAIEAFLRATNRARQEKVLELSAKKIVALGKEVA